MVALGAGLESKNLGVEKLGGVDSGCARLRLGFNGLELFKSTAKFNIQPSIAPKALPYYIN